jgi:2-hydroxy-3-oxopropionate reductase
VASVQPLLSAIGAPVHLGPAGTAQMARLARTMLDAAMTAAIAEAVMMLERADLPDSRQSVALGLGGTLWSSMPSSMQTGEAGPGFAVRNLVADLYDVLQAAHRDGLTLSLAQHLHDRYAYLSEALGHGERDRAAILREVINRNGLGPMGDIE